MGNLMGDILMDSFSVKMENIWFFNFNEVESIDPNEGAGNPAFVSDAIFNSDPAPLD